MPVDEVDALAIHSERVNPTGAASGDATRKALGRPSMPFWEVFLREAVQNSWDARIGDSIEFRVEGMALEGASLDTVRRTVLAELPPSVPDLKSLLAQQSVPALVVSDRGTRGLGGPARADQSVGEGVLTDFRNFAFSIGRDPGRKIGGGTYGFGKAVFYNASRVKTCIVYTRAMVDGRAVDRLIVTRVGSMFEHDGSRYTGRHWWGRVSRTDSGVVVEPCEGAAARSIAMALGIEAEEGQTGTTIIVLDPGEPDLSDDRDVAEAVREIRRGAVRWTWPHFLVNPDAPSIHYSFLVHGDPVQLEGTSGSVEAGIETEIGQYVEAFRAAQLLQDDPSAQVSWQVTVPRIPVDTNRAATGNLAIHRALKPAEFPRELDHRVAVMRGPRFVVKYVEIEADPQGQYTAGVFLSSPELEEAFAAQEPVTHDDWTREPGRARWRPVAWTLDSLRRATRTQVDEPDPGGTVSDVSGVAHLSRVLGEALMGVTGRGAERRRRADGPGRSRVDFSVRLSGPTRLISGDGTSVVVDFPVVVTTRAEADLTRWSALAAPSISVEGGQAERATPPPEIAEVLGWIVDGAEVTDSPEVAAAVIAEGSVAVRLRHRATVAASVQIHKERD